jgi:hypothetical protein
MMINQQPTESREQINFDMGYMEIIANTYRTYTQCNCSDCNRFGPLPSMTLLYYARDLDCIMIVALNSLASVPTTQATAQSFMQLLNYAATHPDAVLSYDAIDSPCTF